MGTVFVMRDYPLYTIDENFNKSPSEGNVDPAFKKIHKGQTAFIIWRIENLKVVALPKEQYGTFYESDSYIIYAACRYGQPAGPDVVNREIRGGSIELHIHFWLGARTTHDKSGTAAYKTVELDSYLGGAPTQHREVQGSEGPRFKSYFKDGFTVLSGGTESGFTHVTDTFAPRLFRVKGRRSPIVEQQQDISWQHFNSGDVFILDTKEVVFVWCGRGANNMEKIQGTKIATKMKDEHNASMIVFVDDGYEQTLHDSDKKIFQKYLDLKHRAVKTAEEVDTDEHVEVTARTAIKLYRCSDADTGKYRIAEIKTGPLNQSDLNTDDVFILDNGPSGIWVWVGKKANTVERTEAMRNARGFIKKKKYPEKTQVTRAIEGGESIEFKMLFPSWVEKSETKGFGKKHTVGRVAKISVTKFDANTMHQRPQLAAETQLIDDGSGTIKVWRLNKMNLVEVPESRHGIFFANDCYVVLYNYSIQSGNKHIIYYWQGLHSSIEEKGASALRTIEKDDELRGMAVQVRVVQGREPAHFLQLFKGKMITFSGSGLTYDSTGQNLKSPPEYLLQVVGTSTYSTRATEVPLRASSLNSNDCFVLVHSKSTFVWCGKSSTGDEREMAKAAAVGEYTLVMERKEPVDFWTHIGGKTPYVTVKLVNEEGDPMPARLFQCSTATGRFRADEILNFVQTDLAPEDVMLLDTKENIFIWIGLQSTEEEKKLSMETAAEYLLTDPSGRDPNTPIITVKQGNEPPTFTGFFGAWDHSLWENHIPFEAMRKDIEAQQKRSGAPQTNGHSGAPRNTTDFDKHHKYPINVLKRDQEKLPISVDPQKKETHLTHDDFVELFKMNYEDFVILPTWKRQDLKKKAGLF